MRVAHLPRLRRIDWQGAPFYPHEPQRDTLRLNFSNQRPELIAEGMARLGACTAAQLAEPRAALG